MSDVAQLNDFLPGGALAPTAGPLVDARIPLIGLDREGLAKVVADMGEPAFRAKQLYSWLYYRGSSEFSAMTDLSKAFRARLEETCHINRPRVSMHQKSTDGTEKWLLRYEDGNEAEMVFIPEVDRGTLCISSQVGCSLTCTFCHTGTQKLVRNLTPGDIVGQVMLARDSLNDWGKAEDGDRRITNIVLMGMGEPLYNTDNVLAAMRLVADGDGIAISRRRITLSTSGVVPDIKRVGEEMGLSLAVSLHAVRAELRKQGRTLLNLAVEPFIGGEGNKPERRHAQVRRQQAGNVCGARPPLPCFHVLVEVVYEQNNVACLHHFPQYLMQENLPLPGVRALRQERGKVEFQHLEVLQFWERVP